MKSTKLLEPFGHSFYEINIEKKLNQRKEYNKTVIFKTVIDNLKKKTIALMLFFYSSSETNSMSLATLLTKTISFSLFISFDVFAILTLEISSCFTLLTT
jgi:hypothetical protein